MFAKDKTTGKKTQKRNKLERLKYKNLTWDEPNQELAYKDAVYKKHFIAYTHFLERLQVVMASVTFVYEGLKHDQRLRLHAPP